VIKRAYKRIQTKNFDAKNRVSRSRNLSTITRDWKWPLSLVSSNLFF